MNKLRLLFIPLVIVPPLFFSACSKTSSKPVYGLQLYSVREEFAKDAPRAIELVSGMGFTEVETAGTAGMSAAEFRAALEARGLKPVSAHVQYAAMEKDIAAEVQTVKTLGAKYAFCPWIPHEGAFNGETVRKAAENFNSWGAAFKAEGIQFGYHPHGYEFVAGDAPGETRFDELARLTNPDRVSLQMDVFWAYRAGGDPVALLKKYPDRWVSLHIKDIRKGAEVIPGSSGAPPTDKVAVGTGQIDWTELLGVAREQGISHWVIEDESRTPLDTIPASMRYLEGLKL